jgi:predicted Rossmann fold flavoprotein
MRIAVIGGGAAGFFAAISAKHHHPTAEVLLFEKSNKLLAKVRVSGGGRCNVTHDQREPRKLARNYPRGGAFLQKAFAKWCVNETVAWFEERGVRLKTEEDGRMFPITDDSGTIIDALMTEIRERGITIHLSRGVTALERSGEGWSLNTSAGTIHADRVIIAAGGSPKAEGLQWLADLGCSVVPPVPSLFTFNTPNDPIKELMGVVVDPVRVRLEGTKVETTGPLLVTHWGLSGPAVLKASAWGARELHRMNYAFTARINWAGEANEEEIRVRFAAERERSPKRMLRNSEVLPIPSRMWEHLLHKAGIDGSKVIGELGKHDANRLIALITNDTIRAQGKTTFKEEFVTAGGVALDRIDPRTMRHLDLPGLYFAGEVLDIDGVTGGFNFQAAWTTGWIAGQCE